MGFTWPRNFSRREIWKTCFTRSEMNTFPELSPCLRDVITVSIHLNAIAMVQRPSLKNEFPYSSLIRFDCTLVLTALVCLQLKRLFFMRMMQFSEKRAKLWMSKGYLVGPINKITALSHICLELPQERTGIRNFEKWTYDIAKWSRPEILFFKVFWNAPVKHHFFELFKWLARIQCFIQNTRPRTLKIFKIMNVERFFNNNVIQST